MRVILLFLVLVPVSAWAEVSDKIPSIFQMWVQGIIFGVICFYLASKKWWLAIVGVGLSIILFAGVYDMEADKYMRQAVINEQGETYLIYGYLSSFVVLLLAVLGIIYGYKKRSNSST
jgi:hypothetical protein